MNNNRGGNNRRRGRSNNNARPQGSNGGQQVNRIDSRARGNAPQMLEKYRKLANDAHLNGDRVNAEYYLQFADHYFRVSADTRVRQEEQRLRRDDRWHEGGEGASDEGDDGGEFGSESEFPAFDQPPVYTRREREDRPDRTGERASEPTADRNSGERGQAQANYGRRDERPAADGFPSRQPARNDSQDGQATTGQAWKSDAADTAAPKVETEEAPTAYEPPENPFLRENRGARGLRPRREDRRPRREDRPEIGTVGDVGGGDMAAGNISGQLGETDDTDRSNRAISAGIDPDSLPPSFTVPRDELVESEPAPAPRRRARRKPAAETSDGSGTGEPIQSLI